MPYFYQASNKNNPYSSCGATSTAMLINFRFGSKTNPDKLQVSYGKSAMQSPEGIAKTMGRFGLKTKWTRTGTRSQIKSHLKAGRPVIVHGFWTNSGHIVVITGFNSSAWILHDPAGDWNRGYFRSSSAGRSIKHSFGGSFDKKMSSDGDIWFSTASKSSF